MPLRRPPVRLLVAVGLVAVLLVGGWLALRDAPLFRVKDVTVAGATGPQASAIREAVASKARTMTTTHLDDGALRQAVEAYPIVRTVTAERVGLKGVRVRVEEHDPVAELTPKGGAPVPVAADGTLLRGAAAEDVASLPTTVPAGAKVTDPKVLAVLRVLAAAPRPLRLRVASVAVRDGDLAARLRDGPLVRFGDAARPRAKWASLTAVLSDPTSRGASEIDLQVPERPTALGLPSGAVATTPEAGTAPGATVDPTSTVPTTSTPAAPAVAAVAPSTQG